MIKRMTAEVVRCLPSAENWTVEFRNLKTRKVINFEVYHGFSWNKNTF